MDRQIVYSIIFITSHYNYGRPFLAYPCLEGHLIGLNMKLVLCSVRPNANFACNGQYQKYQPREGLDDLITFSMPKYTFSSSRNTIMLLRFNLRPRDQMVPMSLNAFCKQLSTRHNAQMVTQIEKMLIPS